MLNDPMCLGINGQADEIAGKIVVLVGTASISTMFWKKQCFLTERKQEI